MTPSQSAILVVMQMSRRLETLRDTDLSID